MSDERSPISDSETPGWLGIQHPASLSTHPTLYTVTVSVVPNNVSGTQMELSSSGASLNYSEETLRKGLYLVDQPMPGNFCLIAESLLSKVVRVEVRIPLSGYILQSS